MSQIRLESLVLAIGKQNGAFDMPSNKAFLLRNPLLLKTHRPEKKVDSEHYRVFTSIMGGFKAGMADLEAKCSGKNHRLTPNNTLADLLKMFGFERETETRPIVLFLRRALHDDSVGLNTILSWFEEDIKEI